MVLREGNKVKHLCWIQKCQHFTVTVTEWGICEETNSRENDPECSLRMNPNTPQSFERTWRQKKQEIVTVNLAEHYRGTIDWSKWDNMKSIIHSSRIQLFTQLYIMIYNTKNKILHLKQMQTRSVSGFWTSLYVHISILHVGTRKLPRVPLSTGVK